MFTGIVAAIGSIRQVSPLGEDGVRLDVVAGELDMSDVAIGDSIAIQGACMTVVEKTADSFAVDVSAESLRRTTGLAGTGPVNLEKAMRLSDRVGGHLVSGHVDGLGVVRRFEPVGESHLLEILAPQALAGFLVYKGSITVDGVSLTVNHVEALPLAKAVDPAWPEAARAVLAGRGPSVARGTRWRTCRDGTLVLCLPDQPDPAHGGADHTQAPDSRQTGQPGNRHGGPLPGTDAGGGWQAARTELRKKAHTRRRYT